MRLGVGDVRCRNCNWRYACRRRYSVGNITMYNVVSYGCGRNLSRVGQEPPPEQPQQSSPRMPQMSTNLCKYSRKNAMINFSHTASIVSFPMKYHMFFASLCDLRPRSLPPSSANMSETPTIDDPGQLKQPSASQPCKSTCSGNTGLRVIPSCPSQRIPNIFLARQSMRIKVVGQHDPVTRPPNVFDYRQLLWTLGTMTPFACVQERIHNCRYCMLACLLGASSTTGRFPPVLAISKSWTS